MKLDAGAVGLSAGIMAGVLYTLGAIAVAIAPGASMQMFGFLLHLDLSSVPREHTFLTFVVGVFCWIVGTGLAFGLGAMLYNRIIGTAALTTPISTDRPMAHHA